MLRFHGTCVAFAQGGVLLRGAPGAGKSDLALRLVDGGAQLVADDQVEIFQEKQKLIARCPATLAGLLEVRGVGIMQVPHVAQTWLRLVVDMVEPGTVERLPEQAECELLGVRLPQLALAPFEAAAPAKLRLVMATLDAS